MKWLKEFALFEDVSQNLPLPKNQEELMALKNTSAFKRIDAIPSWTISSSKIKILRGGSIKICSGAKHCFKVTVGGKLYYGGYQVAPRWIKIENWNQMFDWIFCYTLSTGKGYFSSSTILENFVFNGKSNPKLFIELKHLEQYEKGLYKMLIDLAKEYNGDKIEEILGKSEEEASRFISDIDLVLQSKAFKKAIPIIGESFNKREEVNSIGVFVANNSILGEIIKAQKLWNMNVSTFVLPKNGLNPNKQKTSTGISPILVNTLSGLDKKIKDAIEKFLTYFPFTPYNFLLTSILKWYTGSDTLSLEDEIKKGLEELKTQDPIEYAAKVKLLDQIPSLKSVQKTLLEEDPNLIAGGNIINRFGFGS